VDSGAAGGMEAAAAVVAGGETRMDCSAEGGEEGAELGTFIWLVRVAWEAGGTTAAERGERGAVGVPLAAGGAQPMCVTTAEGEEEGECEWGGREGGLAGTTPLVEGGMAAVTVGSAGGGGAAGDGEEDEVMVGAKLVASTEASTAAVTSAVGPGASAVHSVCEAGSL
jgi:hypothetical protein